MHSGCCSGLRWLLQRLTVISPAAHGGCYSALRWLLQRLTVVVTVADGGCCSDLRWLLQWLMVVAASLMVVTASLTVVTAVATEYRNSRLNITILYWKYLLDIRSEAWLNLCWEYINRNLFAV